MHFIWPNGRGALLTGIEKERPSYERLLSVLQSVPGSKASRSWVDRVNPFSRVSNRAQDIETSLRTAGNRTEVMP